MLFAAVSLGCAAALIAPVGTSIPAGPAPAAAAAFVDSTDSTPELLLDASDLAMTLRAEVLTDNESHHNDHRAVGNHYFGRATVTGDAQSVGSVVYAVETAHDEAPQWCDTPEPSSCNPVEVGIRPGSGLLYLYRPSYRRTRPHSTSDWPARRVQISAEDSSSGIKVYRDVLIDRSERAPDCDDFPDRDRERFACLFLAETLLGDPPETTAALREALPPLTQSGSEYQLIFEEHFNSGVATDSPTCMDGMASLDREIWEINISSFDQDTPKPDHEPCVETAIDSSNRTCFNVVSGHYTYGVKFGCQPQLSTQGRFSYRYGYIEIKVTLEIRRLSQWTNLSFSVGPTISELAAHHDVWDIDIADTKDLYANAAVEMNVVEYVTQSRLGVAHQYINPYGIVNTVRPQRTNRRTYFCRTVQAGKLGVSIYSAEICPNTLNSDLTMTIGVEWTPRGFLAYHKVDDFHNDFVRFSPNQTEIEFNHIGGRGRDWASDSTADRNDFFETFTNEENVDLILEQVGISHAPAFVTFNGRTYARPTGFVSRIHVDYVRVFQPRDGYAGMEPVYQ
ncbi:hypothetical protein [Candidatus Poriferisodalis sp.]|uniref:hypothetical protein n=1 Tax=Candidatus Poriferisodalis sp. TaxID=3101277 RepID=UPI003B01ECE8